MTLLQKLHQYLIISFLIFFFPTLSIADEFEILSVSYPGAQEKEKEKEEEEEEIG